MIYNLSPDALDLYIGIFELVCQSLGSSCLESVRLNKSKRGSYSATAHDFSILGPLPSIPIVILVSREFMHHIHHS